jgi:D-galactarolactone cycloisomerase
MITEIQTYPLLYIPSETYGDANGIKPYRASVLLRIINSEGFDGWGECTGPLPMIVYEAQNLNHVLYRKDEWNRTDIMRQLRDATPRIQAAVDIALWDLIGKVVKQPIHALLGGAYRNTVPVYASMQSYAQHTAQDQWLQTLLDQVPERFHMIKMKIGALPISLDQKLIELALHMLPETVSIAIDANQSYDETMTRAMLEYLQSIQANFLNESNQKRTSSRIHTATRIQWFEEPMPLKQTASYKNIKQKTSIPIAGGENLPDARSCIDFVQNLAIDILQPDILHIGGITQLHFLYQFADHMKIRCSPHTFDSGLARIATLHAASVAKPYSKANMDWDIDPIEWDIMENPFTNFFDPPIAIENGMVTIPQGPGLGVIVDLSSVERYMWDPSQPLPPVQPVPVNIYKS